MSELKRPCPMQFERMQGRPVLHRRRRRRDVGIQSFPRKRYYSVVAVSVVLVWMTDCCYSFLALGTRLRPNFSENSRTLVMVASASSSGQRRSSTSAVEPTTNTKANRAPKKTSKSNASQGEKLKRKETTRNGSVFSELSLVQHDLLTKEEEQELGEAIHHARTIRDKMAQALAVKQTQGELSHQDATTSFVDDLFADDDLPQPIFLEGREDAMVEETDDESLWPSSFVQGMTGDVFDNFDREQEHERRAWFSAKESQLKAIERESFSSVMTDLVDEETSFLRREVDHFEDSEIEAIFGIAGGREALRQVLLQGSLARDKLIRSNVRLVVSIAQRWCYQSARAHSKQSAYSGSWDRPSLDEAIQEGVVGLTEAVDRYDPKRNLRFATYATWWVTNSVRRCFYTATTGCLRVPDAYHYTRSKYRTTVKKFYDTTGSVPGMSELAEVMGIKESRLELILRLSQPLISTDTPLNVGGSTAGKAGGGVEKSEVLISDTLVDADLSSEELVDRSFLRQSLESAMATELAPHERDILRLRLGLDDGVSRTRRQVAQEYGQRISVSEVETAEKRAYRKLRSPQTLSTYKLLSYLDLAGVDKSTMTLQ